MFSFEMTLNPKHITETKSTKTNKDDNLVLQKMGRNCRLIKTRTELINDYKRMIHKIQFRAVLNCFQSK